MHVYYFAFLLLLSFGCIHYTFLLLISLIALYFRYITIPLYRSWFHYLKLKHAHTNTNIPITLNIQTNTYTYIHTHTKSLAAFRNDNTNYIYTIHKTKMNMLLNCPSVRPTTLSQICPLVIRTCLFKRILYNG